MARVTSKDVARLAGVSQTTVSFVMNGRNLESISEATRAAVWNAARELSFVPSSAARALRKGRNDVILCLVPDFAASDLMERFKLTLSAKLAKSGLICVFFHFAGLREPVVALLGRFNPALIVSFSPLGTDEIGLLNGAGIPVINGLFSCEIAAQGYPWIDQEMIGQLQVQHLAQMHDRRIVFVGIDDPRETDFCTPRRRGVEKACRERGLNAPIIFSQADYSIESAQKVIAELRSEISEPVAIAAFNDLVAVSLLAAARASEINVPDNIALMGVDDSAIANLVSPTLTTIYLDISINAETVHRLIAQHLSLPVPNDADSGPAAAQAAPLRLVKRQST